MSEQEKFTHVRFKYNKETKHYLCDIISEQETLQLDLGTDIQNVKEVIRILKEEYGGIAVPPGFMN